SDVEALRAAGAELLDYIPDFTFIVRMNDAARAATRELEQVRWVGLYQPAYRLTADLLARASTSVSNLSSSPDGHWIAAQVPRNDDFIDVVVSVFRGEELAPIVAQVQAMGGTVLAQSQTRWQGKLKLSISPSRLADLAALSGVRWIEPAPQWELTNNLSADFMGVRGVWDTHGLYGDGQTIAVCDSGLDQGSTSPGSLHDDFEDGSGASRVTAIHDRVGDGADDVNSGHGTHVAGSVLGNGDLSGATPSTHTYPDTAYAGMAPEASLVFQAVEENSTGYLTGLPLDLGELFTQADTSGATLHSNSWGAAVAGMYNTDSEAVDQYIWDHPNFTILFSAGNEGVDSDADGVIDLYSMGVPATAKNCITVGASENYRPTGSTPTPGYDFPWGTGSWDPLYPADPVDSDHVSDDPDGMTAFSSRGPTLDGRLKPDIVAPGSNIASTRSSQISGNGWGPIDTNYMFMGGTSMATPLTAGAATIVSQFYSDTQGVTPSAALIKATLVNGATDIAPGQYGTGATQEISGTRPTNVAGWGRVNLEYSLFPTATRVMTYSQNTTGLNTAASDVYTYNVSGSAEPLRVTLAWSDYPGSPAAAGGLVNDLDLTVTGPGGSTYYPNNASQRGASQHLTYDDGTYSGGWMGSAGGRIAVRFTPTSYPATLQTGLFYVLSNSSAYPKTFNWYVYDGDGTTGPGTVLASGSTTIRNMGWHAVDLSGEGVTVASGDFFLAIELPDNDLVWTYDRTTPLDGRSWDYFGTPPWTQNATDDYMFNAIVKSADASTDQDRVNNLVGVDIPTPASGVYTVTVSGYNVPQGPQPYALVASGAITTTVPNASPSLVGLPDQIVAVNGSADNAIDLWAYADDAEDADADMTFSIVNTPVASAGVTLDSNRYIDINPSTDWSGVTDVVVQVQDTGGLTDTDTFQVTIDDVPNIEVVPPALEETLFEGQIYTATLTVSNTGTAQLSFWLDSIGVSWLSADPTGGAVPAGGAQSLDVIFDATGQSIGDYSTDLVVNSTDADDTPWTVPVTMHVTAMVNTSPTLAGLPDQEVAVNGSADNAIDLWTYA
ncbi:MAG: S8 family serine peptidase, partial [Anaerolineae bacterium]